MASRLLSFVAVLLLLTAACSTAGDPARQTPGPASGPSDSLPAGAVGFVTEFTDIGGEITEITLRDGTTIYPAPLALVEGTVFDSTKGELLPGVRATIVGTDLSATADSAGVYRLAVPLEGEYAIRFYHPWLDSIGYPSPEDTVSLARGATQVDTFAVPSVTTVLDRLCGEGTASGVRSNVVGVVRDSLADAVPGAVVTASWQEVVPTADVLKGNNIAFFPDELSHSVTTDESGFYAICGLPPGHPIAFQTQLNEQSSRMADVIFPWAASGRVLLAWDRVPGIPYERAYVAPHPIWKLDLELGGGQSSIAEADAGAILSGIVADRMTGQGLPGVTVVVNDIDSTVTRQDGTFDLLGLEWVSGEIVVSFRLVGYRPWDHVLQVDRVRRKVVLSVMLRPIAVALEPVIVEAERINRSQYLERAGFYDRERRGLGHHVMPEWIDRRRDQVVDVSDFLLGIPGVQTLELAEPTGPGGEVTGRVLVLGSGVNMCLPNVYVDGMPTMFGASIKELSSYVWPEDVYAIEVYRRASELPVRFSEFGAGCAVLIWTRRGRR